MNQPPCTCHYGWRAETTGGPVDHHPSCPRYQPDPPSLPGYQYDTTPRPAPTLRGNITAALTLLRTRHDRP